MNYLVPLPPAESLGDSPITPDPDEPHGPRWTPARMAAFLRLLSATHSVSAAARGVGMGRQSAYKLRARLKGQPFDLAWQCATRRHYDALLQHALERAIHGVEVPHFHQGELIHTSRRYDERLTVALLALRQRIAPPPAPSAGRGVVDPDEFDDLVDCVEHGGEYWGGFAARGDGGHGDGDGEHDDLGDEDYG